VKDCARYLNAIRELVDGTLGPLRRAELDLHLERSEDCAALRADLQRIAAAARALPPIEPPDRVWLRVSSGLHQEGRLTSPPTPLVRPRSYTMLALAAALVLAVAASMVVLLPRGGQAPTTAAVPAGDPHAAAGADTGNTAAADPVQGVDSELAASEQHFTRALEEATRVPGAVDPRTVAVLQKNLLVVNQALEESRAALKTDPQSVRAHQSFYDVLKQKIQFLQDTIALMNEMRQGDAAGAARIVDSGKS
jgi:hypothetical protein